MNSNQYNPNPSPRPRIPDHTDKKSTRQTLLYVFLSIFVVGAIVLVALLFNVKREEEQTLKQSFSHPSDTPVIITPSPEPSSTPTSEPSSTPTAELVYSSSNIQALRVGYYDAELGYSDYTLEDGRDYPLWTTESNSVSPEPIQVDQINTLDESVSIQSFGDVGVMFSFGSLSQAGMPSGNNHLYVYGGTRLDLINEQGLTDIVLTEGAVFLKMAGEAEIAQIVFPRHRNVAAKLIGGSGLFVTDLESVSFWCISEDCQLEFGDELKKLQQGQIRVYKPLEESLSEPEDYQPPSERYKEYVLWNNKCNLCMPYNFAPEPTLDTEIITTIEATPTKPAHTPTPTATPKPGVTMYTLTVLVEGQGSVSPNGGSYEAGSRVTLTASPASGWQFVGWSTGASGLSTTITMNDNMTVTARFQEMTPVTYKLAVTVEGQGTVSLNPPGGHYQSGSVVTLTASPAEGWEFATWSTGATSTTTTVTMDGNKTITATFRKKAPTMYTLTVTVNGQGWVSSYPSGGSYEAGTEVKLTATPAGGWEFSAWSTGETSSTITVTMNSNISITATFTQYMYSLIVYTSGQGWVRPDRGLYMPGTVVSLEAYPYSGWVFDRWSNGSTSRITTVTMNSDVTITAYFVQSYPYPPYPRWRDAIDK